MEIALTQAQSVSNINNIICNSKIYPQQLTTTNFLGIIPDALYAFIKNMISQIKFLFNSNRIFLFYNLLGLSISLKYLSIPECHSLQWNHSVSTEWKYNKSNSCPPDGQDVSNFSLSEIMLQKNPYTSLFPSPMDIPRQK